ncbi:MAG: hypothetical protein WCG06_05570, partial [Candidatus Omnitrophota bacterium]
MTDASRPHQTKFIFVTGGVVSSLGKGIAVASLARLLPRVRPRPACRRRIVSAVLPPAQALPLTPLTAVTGVDGRCVARIRALGLRARGSFRCPRPAAECACDFLVSVPIGPDGKPVWRNAIV